MENVIEIRSLRLAFGNGQRGSAVLENLDLDVRRGEFVAIVGASGVGKSTLLRVLTGLVPPSGGTVRLSVRPDPARLPVALVFQDARLLPWRRVLSNATFGLDRLAVGRAERRQRAMAALELVGLGGFIDRWPHQLSGGQRQRVALARALAVAPELLLMDEPFGALDAITRETMQDELLRVWKATGKTILFVTHDIDEAVYLADRVIVLAGSPAHVVAEETVTLPRPRFRGDLAGMHLTQAIRNGLSLEADGGGI